MRVMITGGTGFVGYHTVRELLDAGHEVSLLVRSVDKMLNLFEDEVDAFQRGTITDHDAIARALEGCDAVVHAAAAVSTSAADAEKVFRNNLEGARMVIDTALEYGVDAVIHVSSVTALFDPDAEVLDEHSPPGSANNAYGRSKVACEKYVRALQDEGYPVHITYPATVIGPDDPGLTEAHEGIRSCLFGVVPAMPSGNQYVDVRDVALAHRLLLEQAPEPGRYTLGGHYLRWSELGAALSGVTGRRFVSIPTSGAVMRGVGRLLDRFGERILDGIPMTEEAMSYATQWVPMDNSKAESELGLAFRPLDDSLRDTIRWLFDAGHITGRQAGLLAAGKT